MKSVKMNFKRALCLMLVMALIVSTVVVMSVSATAATISNDENVFTTLEAKESLYLALTNSSQADNIANGDAKGILGVVSSSGSGGKMYSRSATIADGSTANVVKFATGYGASRAITFGKANVAASGAANAFILEPDTKYTVSYMIKHDSGIGISFELLASSAINSKTGYVLDSETPTVATKAWVEYSCTFTTPDAATLGDCQYLQFAITVPAEQTIDNVVWLYGVTITKSTTIDKADLITFNDNGKTYYAYPDALTALPNGDNGALGSEFIGWYDVNGNEVTEVPAAGTVLNAKYPLVTELPDKQASLYLALTNTYEANNISHNSAKSVLGVASGSNSNHRMYSRTSKLADGSSGIIIKFADSWTTSRSITFGKANVAASGADDAYVVEPNTKYTVSYNLKHDAGLGVSFDIIAGTDTSSTSGYVLDTNKPAAVANAWTYYTCTFTTPDAVTLGNHKYLQFAITVPEGETINNTAWLYGVTITKTTAGDPADYISLVDGDTTYYTEPQTLSELPKGQLAEGDNEFFGWYDGDGNRVTAMPTEAGTVLTAKYGVIAKGTIATSIREVSGTGDTYKSAGIRFRGRLDNATVEVATEIGFILVPTGQSVDSSLAIKAVNKSRDEHIIYDLTYDGYTDYQVILTGLTREGSTTSLCSMKIDVYFYYTIDGEATYSKVVTKSYDDVVAMMEADLPTVNNTVDTISAAPTGAAAADKLTGSALTLTPPEYKTTMGSANYLDATDDTTLMTVTNTTKLEYEAYLAKLEELGYTAIVGNSRILSSSQSFSAIYSDGTNLINVAFIASEKTVKATIEPIGLDTVDEVNDYLSIFHSAPVTTRNANVCDPLFLTVGLSTSEHNGDEDQGFYHGLGYIYRLVDGSFVIIDGGHNGDVYDHAGKIYSMLKYYAPDPENIVISAWIMTHAHSDHMYVFKSFAPKYLADESYNITLKNIIANLPNEAWIAGSGLPETVLAPFRTLFAECEQRGTAVYKAHVGQVYNLPGFTSEILYTLEQNAPKVENSSMSNTSSMIFRVVVEGKSFLFTADATSTSIAHVNAAFGNKMDSDFVQVPHHGTLSNFATDTREELGKFYTEYTTPSYALWPSAEAGMNIYLAKDVSENINAVLGTMLPYDRMIALGNNIDEIKLNADIIDIKTLEYYEIGYLKSEPVAITTEEEFKAIADAPYGYYYLANDITITEEFTAPYWSKFAAYLDGKGCTVTFANGLALDCTASNCGILCNNVQGVIRNINFGSETAPISIAYSESAAGAMGLFGSVLSDVVFDNVNVYAEIEHTINSSYGNYVGGFIGRIYHSSGRAAIATFKNCGFYGTYTESKSGNLKVFGGFVGGMTGAGRLNVSNCTIDATLVGKSTSSDAGIGGVIGRISAAHTVYIKDAVANGSFTGGKYVGGIVGNADTASGIVIITDCTNKATLTGGTTGDMCGNAGTVTAIVTTK